jgi:mannose-1-phosphate guanylyltransferase
MAVHATILAGGAGTRLWPRSRRGQPKHLLALQKGGAPLLRQTFERVRLLVDEVHIVTEQHQIDGIREVLPELTPDHLIVEPVARGTASALGLAAMTIAERDADAVMLSIPSDHIVGDGRRFGQTIRRVIRLAAQSSQLVTVGLTPYYPATGFGYIRTDGQVRYGRTTGLKVAEFIEKPAFDRASRFVESGGYYWNLAIFCWRVETLLFELGRHAPIHHDVLREVVKGRIAGDEARVRTLYGGLPNDAIDYAVMEKTDQLLLIPARFHWIDVGSWSELHSILPKDLAGNVTADDHLFIDSESSLFDVPGKFVAAIGVKDLVVVESGNALLICQKSRAQEVKGLVEHLRQGVFAEYT